jgi:HNH endonuclease/NUMOD4 motif
MDEVQNNIEIWKAIDGISSYEVSNFGRVRNSLTKLVRKLKIDRYGYPCLTLRHGGRMYHRTAHVLVCTAFHGPKPSEDHEVNHIDGVKSHNGMANLEWITQIENRRHALRTGLAQDFHAYYPPPKGSANPWAKINEREVWEIRSFPKSWSNRRIAILYGIARSNLGAIRSSNARKHVV